MFCLQVDYLEQYECTCHFDSCEGQQTPGRLENLALCRPPVRQESQAIPDGLKTPHAGTDRNLADGANSQTEQQIGLQCNAARIPGTLDDSATMPKTLNDLEPGPEGPSLHESTETIQDVQSRSLQ